MQEIIVYIIVAVAVFFTVKRLVAKDNKCGCGCDKCDCHGDDCHGDDCHGDDCHGCEKK